MNRWLTSSVAFAILTVAAVADDKTVALFNGKDLTGWKVRGKPETSKWKVGTATLNEKNPATFDFMPKDTGDMVNTEAHSHDIFTEAKFGDCTVEVELMIPKGSNSGVYLMGEYEVQVLDSYGKEKVGPGDMGGIYANAAPRVNACKKPGEWQKFVIEFQAPKFDAAGKKTENAKFIKVTLNDQVIHENVEVKAPTPACLTGKESATGPLMLQGDHGPVSFRNIRIQR
jgi:Domain of Unknown Function (DUF1080)